MNVALLGTGLIGGSIGFALRRVAAVERIVAFDRDPRIAERAVDRGAADAVAPTPAQAAAQADLVFVATPVGVIPEVVRASLDGLRPGAVVTDVGSTKSGIVREAEPLVAARGAAFIGGHPMAGSEDDGVEAARSGLFDGAWWLLTPSDDVDPEAYRRLHSVIAGMGAQVMAVAPEHHDGLMAVISHLPHLAATSLMNLATERSREHAALLALAAGGFRDMTRVAASNPEIWIDICRENGPAIAQALDDLMERLNGLKSLIVEGQHLELRSTFLSAREARRGLPGKETDGAVYHLSVPIPDRHGVLARITTMIGNLGVNIEDLDITHSPEGGRGVLRLTIAGTEQARRAATALETDGFDIRVTSI